MSLIDEYNEKEEQLRAMQGERDKLMGQLEQLKKDLTDKFGVSTIVEAEELLLKNTKRLKDIEKRSEELLKKINDAIAGATNESD